MRHPGECLGRHCLDGFFKRQHPGGEARPLVVRAVVVCPLPHQPLLLRVGGVERGQVGLAALASGTQVGLEAAIGFERYVPGSATVALGVEVHPAAVRGEYAPASRWRRMRYGAPGRVTQERYSHLVPSRATGLEARRALGDALGLT